MHFLVKRAISRSMLLRTQQNIQLTFAFPYLELPQFEKLS